MEEKIEITRSCDALQSPGPQSQVLFRVGAGSILQLLRDEDRDYFKVAVQRRPVYIPKHSSELVESGETKEILEGSNAGGSQESAVQAVAKPREHYDRENAGRPIDVPPEEEFGTESTSSSGGMTIRVAVDDSVYRQGDRITGTVYVTGGNNEVLIGSLKLEFQEYWIEGSGEYASQKVETLETSNLEERPVSIVPSFERAYPYAFQLPQNCRLSKGQDGWQIVAIADRQLRLDPKTKLRLEVIPANEILAIVEACKSRLKYTERGRIWEPGNVTGIEMRPSVAFESQIDYMRFNLIVNGTGGVEGSLHLKFPRKSPLESLRTLFRSKPKRSLALDRDELFHTDGDVNEEAIAKHVRGLVDEIIRERRRKT